MPGWVELLVVAIPFVGVAVSFALAVRRAWPGRRPWHERARRSLWAGMQLAMGVMAVLVTAVHFLVLMSDRVGYSRPPVDVAVMLLLLLAGVTYAQLVRCRLAEDDPGAAPTR